MFWDFNWPSACNVSCCHQVAGEMKGTVVAQIDHALSASVIKKGLMIIRCSRKRNNSSEMILFKPFSEQKHGVSQDT